MVGLRLELHGWVTYCTVVVKYSCIFQFNLCVCVGGVLALNWISSCRLYSVGRCSSISMFKVLLVVLEEPGVWRDTTANSRPLSSSVSSVGLMVTWQHSTGCLVSLCSGFTYRESVCCQVRAHGVQTIVPQICEWSPHQTDWSWVLVAPASALVLRHRRDNQCKQRGIIFNNDTL